MNLDNLHSLLERLNASPKLDYNKIDSLLVYFKEYEKKENYNLVFPKYDNDPELFYALINKLFKSSEDNIDCIKYIFEFRFTIKRIVEWAEFLSELTYQVALNNTIGFLKVYEQLDNNSKSIIQNDLFWLKENNELNNFIEKLNNIKEKQFIDEIEELKKGLL